MSFKIKISHPWHYVLICIWPLIFLLINNQWIFNSPTGYIDPWLYLGFIRNLPAYLKLFPDTYYGSRLAWLLPGYIIHRLFPPLVANYVLHLGIYYLVIFSCYFLFKRLFNSRTALVCTLLLGSYTWFLKAVGWD